MINDRILREIADSVSPIRTDLFNTSLSFAHVPDIWKRSNTKKVSEYDQEIPQSQTADNPWHPEEEPLNHHETSGIQIKQSNQLSLPHQDDCNTRMDIK